MDVSSHTFCKGVENNKMTTKTKRLINNRTLKSAIWYCLLTQHTILQYKYIVYQANPPIAIKANN